MRTGEMAEKLIQEIEALEDSLTEEEFRLNVKMVVAGYLRRSYDLGRIAMAGRVGAEDGP